MFPSRLLSPIRLCTLITFALVCASGTLSAQTTNAITLEFAIESAWQRSLAARENTAQLERANAEKPQHETILNGTPSLSLEHRNARLGASSGGRETEIGLAMPLWLPGQRNARAELTQSSIELAKAMTDFARWKLAGEVRETAWHAAGALAEMQWAERQVDALNQLAADIDRRVVAGDLARVDSLSARAESLAATVRRDAANAQLAVARSRWIALTGLDALPALTREPASSTSARRAVTGRSSRSSRRIGCAECGSKKTRSRDSQYARCTGIRCLYAARRWRNRWQITARGRRFDSHTVFIDSA